MLKMSHNEFMYLYIYKCLDCQKYLGEIIVGNNERHVAEQLYEYKLSLDKECGFCGNTYDFEDYGIRLKDANLDIIKLLKQLNEGMLSEVY